MEKFGAEYDDEYEIIGELNPGGKGRKYEVALPKSFGQEKTQELTARISQLELDGMSHEEIRATIIEKYPDVQLHFYENDDFEVAEIDWDY